MDYIYRMLFYSSFDLWLNIAMLSILPISTALIYYGAYSIYKGRCKEAGENAEKWLSLVLFALIILIVEIILLIINYITEENLLLSFFFDAEIIERLISLAAMLIIPAIAVRIYRSQYKRFVEGKKDRGIIRPLPFGVFVLLIEAAVGYWYIALMMWAYA